MPRVCGSCTSRRSAVAVLPVAYPPARLRAFLRPIVAFHRDDEDHWVADLECGHGQHVRHEPPLISRPWVLTSEGRRAMLGTELTCRRCVEDVAPENP